MKTRFLRNPFRGSTILSVVLFTTVALLLIGSLLSWSMTERRLNYRNALLLEARNAAEALSEYGFSQIRQKMETRGVVNLDPDGPDALALPPSTFWTGSNVNTAQNELIGGTLKNVPASGADYYYNPVDPNNESDPLKGKYVWRRDVQVISKATVTPVGALGGGPITAYVSQKISVRGAPLFAHAIFYNMDLEIFPGANMTISGPVHTNGNLYLYPSANLAFSSQVTTTGKVYHAAKPGDTADGAGAANRNGNITFIDKSNVAQNLKVDNIWKDSTQGNGTAASDWVDFRDYASQRWNGNLQTAAHGVENYTPVAVSKYQEDPTPGGTDDSVNTGRAIIEPPAYPDPSDPYYTQKKAIEEQKYSSQAGLYITVNPATQTITLSSRDKNDPTKNKPLTLPSGNTLVDYKPFKATSNYTTTYTTKSYEVSETGSGTNAGKKKYKFRNKPTTVQKTITYTSGGANTTSSAPSYGSANLSNTETGWLAAPPADDNSTTTPSNTTPSAPTLASDNEGMYDQHREKGTDLVEIDMDALRKAVAKMANQSATLSNGTTVTPTATDAIGNLTTDDWTGVVYVEVVGGPTTDPITGVTNSPTIPASMQTSVRIVNGTGKVPSYVGTNSPEGLTIATNAPVYIKGHFNADGTTSASSPNSATTPETGEVPAAIVADAVTILSGGFVDANSMTSNPNPILVGGTANSIEISAALLTGLTPTNKNATGKSSGGAHNLPRFLENWGGSRTVYIRGSLVSLFESRVFTEPYDTTSSGLVPYYGAPARNWGFNSMFREGRYPPGTPRVMSYRRVDFTDMTAAQYESAKAAFNW